MKSLKNKIKSTILATTIITSTVFSNTTAFASTSFTDVKQSDWYYSTVTKLADTGIINGTGDGTFQPTAEVGIDSFVTMLVKAMGLEIGTATTSYWAEPYLEAMCSIGYVDSNVLPYRTGILTENDGKYFSIVTTNNSKAITREKMAALIHWALFKDGVTTDATTFDTTPYSDFSNIDNKYNTAVRTVIMAGIMGGKDGGIFDPKGTVTRAEATTVIARYLYPEERLQYTYSAKQENHNVGDVYTDYNTWLVPTEVRVYETGQVIPTIAESSKLYVEELGKYLYVGMPVSEIVYIMGNKGTKQEGKNHYMYYNENKECILTYSVNDNNQYIEWFSINTPYNATFNGHSLGEAPLLMEIYQPRSEYSEFFSTGGIVNYYPFIQGYIGLTEYRYENDGYIGWYAEKDKNDTAELPTETSSIQIWSNQIIDYLVPRN